MDTISTTAHENTLKAANNYIFDKKMSKTDFCKKIGIHPTTYSRYLSGKIKMSRPIYLKILQILGGGDITESN